MGITSQRSDRPSCRLFDAMRRADVALASNPSIGHHIMHNASKAGDDPARALAKDLERMLGRLDIGMHDLGQVTRFELAEHMRFVRQRGAPSVTDVMRAWSGAINLVEFTFMNLLHTYGEFSELRPAILDALRDLEQSMDAPTSTAD